MAQPRIYATPAERQRAYRQRQQRQLAALQEEKRLPISPVLPAMPGTARWRALIERATAMLQAAHDEMASYAEERSERWQESERGEQLATRIEALEDVLNTLEGIED